MRPIGLHLRLTEDFAGAAQKAVRLSLATFQCFFIHQVTNRFMNPTASDVKHFKAMREQFKHLFVHASYWTNFASGQEIPLRLFKRELALAKRLGFTHIIIHSGSAKGAADKIAGIDALIGRLNGLMKYENEIQFVFENTAHGNLSIGGDFNDFKIMLEKSDYPEKFSFCIDTAHAHVFGYALETQEEQRSFIALLDDTIGIERIALIHLNNSNQLRGSCIDKHVLLDQGVLSVSALKQLILNERLLHVPIIMELPIVDECVEQEMLVLVQSWHN